MFEFLRRLLRRRAGPSTGDESLRAAVAGQLWVEEGWRQREEHFDQLVAAVQDYAIFLLDRKGIVATWNAGAERIKGYRPEEILGQPFSRFYPPDLVEQGWPAEELKRAAADGRFENEGWRVRKDGSKFWANVVITALRDEGGGVRGFLKITRDLTERQQAEENARRLAREEATRRAAEEHAQVIECQREQLRVTLTSIGDAVITTNAEGRVTLLNPIAEALTGWTNKDAAGQPLPAVFRIVNETTKQPVENPVAKVLATGRIVGLANHTELIAKDGTEWAIDDSGAPIRDGKGNVAGVVLVFRDVTEQRKAERSARFLASIVESSDDAIIGKDISGIITSWNRGAERIFGYSAAEAVGRPIAMLAPSDRADEMPMILDRIKRGERVEHFDTVRCAKDGRTVPISLTVSPIRDQDGTIVGASKIARDITERKRAEETLRQQREWLRVTLDSIGDAVITTDTVGRVSYLNPVAQVLTRWGQDEAQGQLLSDVFPILHERTRKPVENPVARVLREGAVVGLGNHTVLLARDGTERPIDDSAAPIRGDKGETVGVVLTFRDVTEQRQAQAALRQTEARKSAILDTALDSIITIDHEGKVVEFNPAAERTFGYRRTDVLGRQMAELIVPPNLRDKHYRGLAHYFATGEGPVLDKRIEMPALRSDGTKFPVELAITRISAEGPPLFTAYLRDITENKRAEQASRFLEDASKSLAALVDYESTMQKVARLAVPYFADWCAVDMVEPDGSLRRVAVAHVDLSKVELTKELNRSYPPDPDAPQGVPHILRTGKSELISEITDARLVEIVKNEELLRIMRELGLKSYLGVPLQARGKTVGAITFVAAESGRRFDAVDLAVAEELAHRAGIAMENARLYSEVREADRRKDEFLAMLAHELRNPLAPIRNALHIMKQPTADGAVVDRVREIMERQVQHMTRMVDDLLDVSRITRGKIELRREVVDLSSMVERTMEATRPLIEDRHQQLTVDLPPQPVRLEADPTRLEQVLANLLNNAAKYTHHEGRLWLSARLEGSELVLRVKDTGVGIAPDMLPRIFEPFVQSNRVLHHAQGGLGIGLTLVRRLVEMHGGTVTAHSEGPGQGSEFIVRLPALPQKQPIPGPRQVGEGGEPVRAAPQRRILVVDDNVDAAESLALLLRLEGHDVRVAHDGPAALAAVEADPPDLLFLDIGMPVMNGYDVAQRLRQRPGLETLVLVAMTGWGQEEDRRRSQEAGFDRHLVKPVEPDALHQLLTRPR
jgi:PAS domain S-box-containing protein